MLAHVHSKTMSISRASVRNGTPKAAGFSDAQLLGAIVDTSEDGIVVESAAGQILSWNGAAEQLFGYSADEAIGCHISIIGPPERAPEQEQIMGRLLAGERIRRFATVRRHKDGELLTVELSFTPIKDPKGRVIGAVKVARDLRERLDAMAALREEEERFRVLADNMSQLAWMADSRGRVFWYNKRWLEYTGSTLEQMKGWGWTQVYHPDHVARVTASLQRSWDTGEPWEDEFPLRGHDGQFRWFLSRALPIRSADGRIVRWFGTNTDITAQRQLAEELRTLSDELALANRRKDEFLAALSHEIRNPLAAIRTGVTIMRSQELTPASQARTRAMVERQVAHLSRLLDDLLDVSRSAHGRLIVNITHVGDARAVIDDAIAAARPLFDAAGVTLTTTVPEAALPVEADPARLQQMRVNVLANAARYTRPAGHAELQVLTEGRELVMVVTDSGVGIPADLLPRIFELFAQSQPDTAPSASGLGIGLYLTRELAARHGGTITAASDGPGRGACFTMRLPILSVPERRLAMNETGLPPEPRAAAAPVLARRVLVVDDDHDNAEGLAMLFRLSGHEAEIAHDGPAAIERAKGYGPDVVLLDLGLPGMDGIEACRQLRALDQSPRPFVVAITGWGQPADYERTRAAGFDQHLVKPVEPQRLLDLLAALERSV
jgi:PAS domain S-box-containing protein